MIKNEIQNYLDEKFPELKFIVQENKNYHRAYRVGFRTDVSIMFLDEKLFDKLTQIHLLYLIEDMLYKKLGLLNKALDDVREIRRELT